ncbi:MAG: glucosylceramidase, partial [Ruminococcus sp.]|nr:glucosylceramidase [Ruminococcus sp.]
MNLKLVTTTYQNNQKERVEQNLEFVHDIERENELINLYPQLTYQEIEGFGGAITDSAGYVFSFLNEEQKEEMISQYFGSDNMKYNLVRIPIDSCDFSLGHYEADPDEADENFEKFSFERVEKYILPLLD